MNLSCFRLKTQLLVALVSAYRYEGPKLKEDTAKAEAKTILNVIKSGEKKTDNEEVIRILTTRSKLHLKAVYKDYQEISGSNLDEVRNSSLVDPFERVV